MNSGHVLRGLCLGIALCGAAAATHAATEPVRPIDVRPEQLRPGEFVWSPEVAPEGPLLLVVSVLEQRAFLYRNGVRIAVTTVSSGKAGKETPTGVFTILQKHKEHYSTLYDAAPMPFMQRLTWDGVALHAGRLPGYPASHGCIRLPVEFARRLFDTTALGMTVVVAADPLAEPQLAHPGWLAPPVPGRPAQSEALSAPGQPFSWTPELAPTGPLSLLLSTADGTVRVLRNGVEIGFARVEFDGVAPQGTQVLQLRGGTMPEESRFVPGKPRLDWTRLQVDTSGASSDFESLYRGVRVAPQFAKLIYDSLAPGTTLVVTDLPATSVAPGAPILDAEEAMSPDNR